jgi:hypothetical protein
LIRPSGSRRIRDQREDCARLQLAPGLTGSTNLLTHGIEQVSIKLG